MTTFRTRHPDPDKQGAMVRQDRYEAVREALLAVIPATEQGVRFSELAALVNGQLPNGVPDGGSTGWWTTTVKLDLEARGLIERVPGARPQRVRRAVPS